MRLIVVLSLFLTFQGCRKEAVMVSPKIAELVGTWQLVEPVSVDVVTLTFALDMANPPRDVTPFRASGKSAINTYNTFLSAAVDGLMIIVNLSSTELGGLPATVQLEQTYYRNLRAVVRYEITANDQLRLFHGGSTPGVLVYKRIN